MKEKYGCIGEHLKHSFSKEIHNALADYEYSIIEIAKDELGDFMKNMTHAAINVTIPYKELVIPYLDKIDSHASAIGAVNTVVKKDGKLYGYNTDFYGMTELLNHAKIDPSNKKVVILGTGGTSKTAEAVVTALGARVIYKVSRRSTSDAITYDKLYKEHTDAEIIINTTPVGMFPNTEDTPIDISEFKNLSGVIDAIYNPLSSSLILEAKKRKIPAEGGLYMLVAQAVRASEIFLDKKYPTTTLENIYKKILLEKKNIVLTGMPGSGKSTVGKIIAKKLKRDFIDTDEVIEKSYGKKISEIFSEIGESGFRAIESEAIREVSKSCSLVIASGGGAVLKEENIKSFSKNGKIFFIDRPLNALIPTADRPLSSSKESIEKRYNERYEIYKRTADVHIDADSTADTVSNIIIEDFYK